MDHDEPATEAGGADAASKLLEEQEARIAALRMAVLSGQVPDEETFDYARFFRGPAEDDAPEGSKGG